VEDKEALETRTVVCKAADLVHNCIDPLLSNSVVATRIYTMSILGNLKNQPNQTIRTVAGSIFLASNESLGMEEAPVWAISHFIDDIGLQINVERARHMLPSGSLREKSAEAIIVFGRRAFDDAAIRLRCMSK
jgi:hypothetical protein